MPLLDYAELALATLLARAKAHDAKLFTTRAAFSHHPTPTISITSPSCGPTNSTLPIDCTQLGADKFPDFEWGLPSEVADDEVKEWVLCVEDPDAPIPTPAMHALFYGIPGSVRRVESEDVKAVSVEESDDGKGRKIREGWKFVPNIRGKLYSGARPLMTHGPHRYFFMVIALNEELGKSLGCGGKVTRDQVAEAIVGKVLGWGQWIGVYERKWQ